MDNYAGSYAACLSDLTLINHRILLTCVIQTNLKYLIDNYQDMHYQSH